MKKIISMLLVVAMIVAVAAIGIATTGAAETATVKIYDLNGNAVTEQINVGGEFTVYTTLDVSKSVSSGLIGSVQGTQTYSSSVLELKDAAEGEYGEIANLNEVFPVTGQATMSNASTAGKISFNASSPSKTEAFKFDSATSKLIVTTYKVKSAGTAEVKTELKNLAIADDELTRIVFQGQTQSGKSFSMGATFTDPLALDHAEITVYSLDGTTETLNANIGDEFTVYTTLDASQAAEGGMIGSINATQKYTSSVLQLTDAVDGDGMITDLNKVFPILGDKCMAVVSNGVIKYAASNPSLTDAFEFNSASSQLITTTYKVKANGAATVTNSLIVLGSAAETIDPIVFGGVIKDGKTLSMPASFTDPSGPAPTTLTVTITGPNGQSETKEVNIGESFTVYTVLNTSSVADGNIANVAGTQTYTTSKLKLTDSYDSADGEVENLTAMFPILGDKAMATVKSGVISFSASKPEFNNGFVFNSDKSKLIVTNYKATAAGKASVTTALKTLVASDKNVTKIVWNGQTQSGQSYSMFETFTDPGNPVIPTQPATQPTQPATTKPTQPATQPTQPVTTKPTQPATQPTQPATTKPTQPATQPTQPATQAPSKDTTITIYGLDGKTSTQKFNVGDTFTVYSTFKTSTPIASISGTQTFSSSVLQEIDTVDEYGVVENSTAMFPILGTNAMGRVVEGAVRYNASTPYLGAKGYDFSGDRAMLMITHYKVTAKGTGTIKDALITVAAADTNLTRIVSKGVVADGYTIGGKASFTQDGNDPTEATQPSAGYKLGDADGSDDVDMVDATVVQRVATRVKVPYDQETLMHGDVDGDGELTVVDATFIQRFATRVKTPYPIGETV